MVVDIESKESNTLATGSREFWSRGSAFSRFLKCVSQDFFRSSPSMNTTLWDFFPVNFLTKSHAFFVLDDDPGISNERRMLLI